MQSANGKKLRFFAGIIATLSVAAIAVGLYLPSFQHNALVKAHEALAEEIRRAKDPAWLEDACDRFQAQDLELYQYAKVHGEAFMCNPSCAVLNPLAKSDPQAGSTPSAAN